MCNWLIFSVIHRRNNKIPPGAILHTGWVCANSGLAETETRIKKIVLKKKGQEQTAEKDIYRLPAPAISRDVKTKKISIF